ncbi:N-acetylmuramoyl-L-alanine amidase [Empedobacter sedimenti]|uniref:N-acetylmuramoyl-L-alanine amidase n=1 Tax=Empedobacter sedimenti TaxID=3042610 RepID=UPI0024A7362C|nr:N-acetylmuramoyl-L-alanine amidase [Empedobacter sedimenti]
MNVKGLVFSGISCFFILTSCATNKPLPKTITKVIRDTVIINSKTEQPEMTRAAKLEHYKVTTDYYPSVSQDERVRFLVLHYTAINTELSLKVLTQKDVSSHYLINDYDDKQINLLVDETKRAWHAGISKWKGLDNLNFSSIGIEIVNLGNSGGVYQPYPDYQIKKVGELARDIVNRYNIQPFNVVGHADIAPGRKPDPGPLFPWKKLYTDYGVGAWYEETDKYLLMQQYPWDTMSSVFITDVQNDLKKYGYDVPSNGMIDAQTKNAIIAFQMHFRPEKYDGVVDSETWAILKALNKKYNP